MIACLISDLDLTNLSLWLVDLDQNPVVLSSLRATINTITESKLVLDTVAWLQFIDSDKRVVIIELVDGWEVFVLVAALERHVRIGFFVHELDALSLNNILKTFGLEFGLSEFVLLFWSDGLLLLAPNTS